MSLPVKNKIQLIIAAGIGNILEYYDFALYAVYAHIIGQTFFRNDNSLSNLLFSFSVFASGFIVRPLGAYIFGYIADKYDRKTSMYYSISLMGLATIGIGLLPGYDSLGIFSVIFLVLLRLAQGISAGGEYSTSAMAVLENVEQQRGLIGGILVSTCVLGTIVSTFVSLGLDQLNLSIASWRIAFVLGGMVAFVGFYLRRYLPELVSNKKEMFHIQQLKNYKSEILTIVGIGAVNGSVIYSIYGFLPNFLAQVTSFPFIELKKISLWALFALIIISPIGGYLSQKKPETISMTSAVLLLVLSPIFYGMFGTNAYHLCVSAFLSLGILGGFFVGAQNYLSFQLIPQSIRCLSVGLGYSLGMALCGGTVGSISLIIYKYTENIQMTSLWLCICCLIFLLPMLSIKTTKAKNYMSGAQKTEI